MKIGRQFILLIWTLFIGQFFHPLGGNDFKGVDGAIVILASCEYYFILKYMKIWCNIQVIIYRIQHGTYKKYVMVQAKQKQMNINVPYAKVTG